MSIFANFSLYCTICFWHKASAVKGEAVNCEVFLDFYSLYSPLFKLSKLYGVT